MGLILDDLAVQGAQMLLVLLLAPLLTGFVRSVKARLLRRHGPPVLQPYRDLLRLLRKDAVLAHNASWLFRVAPYLIFATTWVGAALVPTFATGLMFSWSADLIVIVALLGSARFLLALAGMDVGTSFGAIGSSREAMIATFSEPAMIMIVFTLALIADGKISAAHFYVPFWVKLICAAAIASGTFIGGWRIINTMGNRITPIESPQGFAAEAASGATILASSYYGYPLSTTQVVSGGIIGAGLGKKLASIHWGVAGQMVGAWVLTIPSAGLIGAGAWEITNLFGVHGGVASVVVAVIAAALAAGVWILAQRNKITADDLDRTHVSPLDEGRQLGAEPAAAAG